ncbi:MAG: hypothetical protein A3I02_16175 [Betaproteobacteria bacterium RIFCSPLOWO2_02_FULL_67_26]|nr:MAG: hypothetical protein A3I02_16175 [Betaproteobacteria bacterium RIFCSPLOWO2_02_FULL_67_26]
MALAGASAAATDYVDTAPVISSTPIVERVSEPRQECSTVPVAAPAPVPERNMAGSIVGGIAGAILGSRVGRGSGRTAATAAGAVVGTIAGDRVANPDSERPMTGAVVGGVAGGLLGAQVGKGSGQNAAAAAGAVVGAVAGDRVQNPQRAAAAPAQQCRTIQMTREVIRGYTVVYQYNGRDITTTLPYDPGQTVRVGIGVIDGAPAAAVPNAGMMGSNVRDVGPVTTAPAGSASPTPVSTTGGYQYRY